MAVSRKRVCIAGMFIGFSLVAVSCALGTGRTEALAISPALIPSNTRTKAIVTPGATPSPMPTLTRTFTPSQPPTATATSPYNLPGLYYVYKCVVYLPDSPPAVIISMTFCINTVKVSEDASMQFNVTWTVILEECKNYVLQPDLNNHQLYLEDDLGNKYHHTGAGGCAARQEVFAPVSDDCNGWFVFPPAKPEVRSFRFVDTVNWISIEDIVLGPSNNT
jgi:hypothetical protein